MPSAHKFATNVHFMSSYWLSWIEFTATISMRETWKYLHWFATKKIRTELVSLVKFSIFLSLSALIRFLILLFMPPKKTANEISSAAHPMYLVVHVCQPTHSHLLAHTPTYTNAIVWNFNWKRMFSIFHFERLCGTAQSRATAKSNWIWI